MQFPRGSEAEKYAARWITINPSKAEGDGRPVLIDEEGRIQGGSIPREAHGKPIKELGKRAKASRPGGKAQPKNDAPAAKPTRPERGAASPQVREWASRTFSDPSHAEAFAEWFGASKIVNVDGEPLVAYHGTDAHEFDAFKGDVAYFTPNVDYGYIRKSDRVVPVYLRLQNPYVTDDLSLIEGLGYWPDEVQKLKDQGYDGVVYAKATNFEKGPTGWGDDRPQFAAFYPNQIKSVHNQGTFNESDNRMMYAKGSEAERYALRWITIGRKQASDGKRGGFPVQIDDDGKIVGGKRAESLGLHGTHVSDVKEHFDERRAIQSESGGHSVDFDFGAESTTAKRKAAASELPGKRTAIREKLIDHAGDDERDQASLYERMKTIVASRADHARDFNDQLDEFYGSRMTADKLSLIGKLRKRSDPSRVEGFDGLLDSARRHYPALLNHPEADGDEEWSLAEAIRGGKLRVPTIMDDDVMEDALRGWEPPSEYVSEARDDEWDAVPFAKGSEAIKYSRGSEAYRYAARWCL